MPFTIGLDCGTNSARALVVDYSNGREIGTAVVDYPPGNQGILLNLVAKNTRLSGHTFRSLSRAWEVIQ